MKLKFPGTKDDISTRKQQSSCILVKNKRGRSVTKVIYRICRGDGECWKHVPRIHTIMQDKKPWWCVNWPICIYASLWQTTTVKGHSLYYKMMKQYHERWEGAKKTISWFRNMQSKLHFWKGSEIVISQKFDITCSSRDFSKLEWQLNIISDLNCKLWRH